MPGLSIALESGGLVKLLLTSGGVTNTSIRDALVDLLGKPTADAIALCIPTAQWGHPMCGPVSARGFVSGVPPWGDDLDGLEVAGPPGAVGAFDDRRGALGPLGPRGRRAAGRRRRRDVPVPLDAGVRAGRSPAVTDRHGLGGGQRWQH